MGIKTFTIGAFETNTYLITKGDRAVIIDPGLDFISILDEVKQYKIEAILITHGHVDHIDGCGYIEAPIYVGKEDLKKSNFIGFLTGRPSFDGADGSLSPETISIISLNAGLKFLSKNF